MKFITSAEIGICFFTTVDFFLKKVLFILWNFGGFGVYISGGDCIDIQPTLDNLRQLIQKV